MTVSIGNYSDYRDYGINRRECGLGFKPIEYNLVFNEKCFKNNYSNKTVWDVLGTHLHRTQDIVSNRVRHGEVAAIDEAPWAVFLRAIYDYKLGKDYRCSGSLITLQWVLTAAHCYRYSFIKCINRFNSFFYIKI